MIGHAGRVREHALHHRLRTLELAILDHELPGVHWSRYRTLHDLRAARIDPALNQGSLFRYVVRTYFAGSGPSRKIQWGADMTRGRTASRPG